MTSPCKKCENHSRIFPVCFDNCKEINEFQNSLFYKPVEVEEYLTQGFLHKYEGIYKIDHSKIPQLEDQLY